MKPFIELSDSIQSLFTVWYSLLMIASLSLVIRLLLRRSLKPALDVLLLLIPEYIAVQSQFLLNSYYEGGSGLDAFTAFLTGLPWLFVFLLGAVLTAFQIWEMVCVFRWTGSHVTNHSIKEGLDALPMGLCWYRGNGHIVMKNEAMEALFEALTGQKLLNGRKLESTLQEASLEHSTEEGILKLLVPVETAGRKAYWHVEFRELQEDIPYRELLATDVTEEYENTRLLREKQLQVEELNERLSAYSREIVDTIADQEILNAKVQIHDNLGQLLLASRKYLLRGGSAEEKERLLYQLKTNAELFLRDRQENRRDHLELLKEAANDMGIRLEVSGELPEEKARREIYITAIHENLTNTIRHAHGDVLLVRFSQEDGKSRAVFENNGEVPKEKIEEKGGLKTLRSLVEGYGGTMEITIVERFRMEICL